MKFPVSIHAWGSGLIHDLSPALTTRTRRYLAALLTACALLQQPAALGAEEPPRPAAPPPAPSKFRDFNEVTRSATKLEGFINLYRTNEILYGEIKAGQLNQPIIAPIAIARGMAMAGQPLNFGDEWIIVFRRIDDKIQVVRRNIHYRAPERTPLGKAVSQNYTDSILMALPIVALNGGNVLVDFSQIFFSDFANLRLGAIDRNRCTWHQIKAFEDNVELEVEVTFMRGGFPGSFYSFGDSGVVDSRGMTLVIHYSLAKLPDPSYRPRMADNRVGQFISATKDFSLPQPDAPFLRMINRWRLEKSDPKAKLSPPKKQIVWWVEDTVPHEFRPYVEEGILEWNKAFEKVGYKNAIGVRWQNERDEFDPEDINYCTFRWITTSSTFAMSGLRANPLTGEIIDGDVIFDASWIRYWKSEYAYLVGTPVAEGGQPIPLALGEVISPIMAAKEGFGLPFPIPGMQDPNSFGKPEESTLRLSVVPSQWSPLQMQISQRTAPGKFASCQFLAAKHREMSLAAMVLAEGGKGDGEPKLPEEFLGQAIKEVVMHEVGHSLGLRHNFKASGMLNAEQLNDTSITRVKGMTGSVMDYNPINIVPKGQKQGDFATTTIGPYDYWAIEYAYKPVDGDEAAELKKIASRSPDADLAYATDEDMYMNDDPLVNAFDLGSDPLRYGKDRIALAKDLLNGLEDKIVREGESWARLRQAFSILLGQYGDAAYLSASYIGGQSVNRDFKGANGRDPIIPISGEKQREALKFLISEILSDHAFKFSPALLRRLTTDRWYHWGDESVFYGAAVDYPVYDRVLAIQRIVLNHCLNPRVLSRVQNQELRSDNVADSLKLAEIFQSLTEGVWSEITADAKSSEITFGTIRRNLQREHLQRLSNLVIEKRANPYGDLFGFIVLVGGSGNAPADARSLARYHLSNIGDRIEKNLAAESVKIDDTTRAHLVQCKKQIAKVLEADYTAN